MYNIKCKSHSATASEYFAKCTSTRSATLMLRGGDYVVTVFATRGGEVTKSEALLCLHLVPWNSVVAAVYVHCTQVLIIF